MIIETIGLDDEKLCLAIQIRSKAIENTEDREEPLRLKV